MEPSTTLAPQMPVAVTFKLEMTSQLNGAKNSLVNCAVAPGARVFLVKTTVPGAG